MNSLRSAHALPLLTANCFHLLPTLRYKLFHYIDHNGTGRISWYEFRAFIRTTLELSQDRLPDERIKAVWKALDADANPKP